VRAAEIRGFTARWERGFFDKTGRFYADALVGERTAKLPGSAILWLVLRMEN